MTYEFEFPEETEYDDFRLVLRGLAAVMEEAAMALESGRFGDEPMEELEQANQFQFDLLKANPEVAKLVLDEVKDGDTIAVGDVSKLEDAIEESEGES